MKSVLENDFPKLKDVNGAFEIVRSSGNRRSLDLVSIPPMGYIVPFLKETLGQATGYIRPVQKNFDLTPASKVDIVNIKLLRLQLKSLYAVSITIMYLCIFAPVDNLFGNRWYCGRIRTSN